MTTMTIGDLKGLLDLQKSLAGSLVITDFDALFDYLEQLLRDFNQLTPELEANLDLARAELKANPGLFDVGKATFVESIDALLRKYPPETPLSDIPEFGDTEPQPDPGTDPVIVPHGDIDIAQLDALRAEITVDVDPETGVVTVNGAGYAWTMPDIDRIEFSDGVLALDIQGNAGQLFRLYQAAFDREPDLDGLNYWLDRLDSGATNMGDIVTNFLAVAEALYGTEQSISDADFIDLLYTHALGRDADAEGHAYWLDKLATDQTSRQDLLAYFSESAENQSNTAAQTDSGIWLG